VLLKARANELQAKLLLQKNEVAFQLDRCPAWHLSWAVHASSLSTQVAGPLRAELEVASDQYKAAQTQLAGVARL
jgi:hypothetical protein